MREYDLLTQIEQIKDVKTINGEITSFKSSNFEKKGLRKYNSNQIYYFSYFGEIPIETFISQSKITEGTGILSEFEQVDIKDSSFICDSVKLLNSFNFENRILELESSLKKFQDKFTLLGTYRINQKSLSFEDDFGRKLFLKNSECNHWYRFKRNGSASIMDGYFWNSSLDLSNEYTIDCLEKILSGYDKKASLPDGKYPILFAQQFDAEGSFLEKIKESLVADKYFEGAGLLSGKLNTRIFSEQFNIVDCNLNPDLGIYAPFDGEGFIRSSPKLSLIEKGVIKNLISDQRLAHKYKIPATGNGIRDFNSAPKVEFNSVEILPGVDSTENILKSLPQCVLVMLSGGGDFTDIGDYSQVVEFSYLLEFGEVVGRLPALTVRSTVQKMFSDDLIGIASDNYFSSKASPSVIFKMDLLIN